MDEKYRRWIFRSEKMRSILISFEASNVRFLSPEYSLCYVVFLPISKTQATRKRNCSSSWERRQQLLFPDQRIRSKRNAASTLQFVNICFTTCPRTMKVSCSRYNSQTPPFLARTATLDSLKILTPHPHCYSPTCSCLQTIRKQQKYRSCSHQSCDQCKLLYGSSRSAVSADAALDSVESLCRIRIAIRKYILC